MRHSLALKCDGTVVAWGITHTNLLNNFLPTNVPALLSNLIAISADWHYGVALSNHLTTATNFNTLLACGQTGDSGGRAAASIWWASSSPLRRCRGRA